MGVPPNIWGPNLWGTLHLLCLTGTITPNFVQEFTSAIPCSMCSGHFSQLVSENPLPETQDPSVLFEWSVLLHNKVNEKLGKPIISVDQAMRHWTSSQFDIKIIIYILILILLIFICVRK